MSKLHVLEDEEFGVIHYTFIDSIYISLNDVAREVDLEVTPELVQQYCKHAIRYKIPYGLYSESEVDIYIIPATDFYHLLFLALEKCTSDERRERLRNFEKRIVDKILVPSPPINRLLLIEFSYNRYCKHCRKTTIAIQNKFCGTCGNRLLPVQEYSFVLEDMI